MFFGNFNTKMRNRSSPTEFVMNYFSKTHYCSEWQTIKQGAMFYILLTALFIPSGICSWQDQTVVFHPTPMDLYAMLDTSHLWGAFDYSAIALEDIPEQEAEPQPTDDPPFNSYVLQAAQAYDVDAALIRAIIMVESSNNPRAVSHRGAQGLMQLMPTTARWLGVEDSFNPQANIDAGVRYFRRLLDRFNGDVKLALAAYNAGSRYVCKYKGIPPFKATRSYIKKVLEYHRHFSDDMPSSGIAPSAV
jgi:hypothetical protein